MGDSTLALAAQNPETNYLAVDVHNPGIGRLLAGIQERQLMNIRVLRGDIAELLTFFPNECLSAVLIYFPDPWPKARHHKRRLIQPQFLMQLARAVQPMGLLHIATDWEDYAQHCLDTLTASPFWENTADSNFIPRPSTRPLTKFERRGQAEGRLIRDLLFRHIRQTN